MTRAKAIQVVQGTPEWHAFRRTGVGSSDAPVIAGERGSVVDLWAEKTGLVEPQEPDDNLARLFEWGHRLEPVVADWYADTTGRKVRRVNRVLVHPDVPWAFASLDRVAGDRVVEIKTTRRGWDTGEPVPGFVQAQVQHQLWVTGYDLADVAVLTGGSEPRIHEVPRDDGFIAALQVLEAEFMSWVKSGTRPPVDGSENYRRVLGRLHPVNQGSMLPRDDELDRLFMEWQYARREQTAAEERVETLANTLRTIIGDNDGIDGLVTWKKNSDSQSVNWPAVASAYRALLEEVGTPETIEHLDTIQSIHTSTVEGPRVLRRVKGAPEPGLPDGGPVLVKE